MDKEALVKTLKLIDGEIEALMRAKRELQKQLSGTAPVEVGRNRVPRGAIKSFLHETLQAEDLTVDEIMHAIEQRDLGYSRNSIVLALKRGKNTGEYKQKGVKWTL